MRLALGAVVLVALALPLSACGSSSSGSASSQGGGGASATSTGATAGSGGAGGDATASSSVGDAASGGPTGSSSSVGGGGGGVDVEPTGVAGITAAHNAARAAVSPAPATPIPPLAWSSAVAATAEAWASGCEFVHNPNSGYGENIYATSGSATPADVVADWVAEKSGYDYATNSCSKSTCGHYTQVVWAKTTKLGCGVANCTTGSPFGTGAWQLWVCDYDPPGNYSGEKPY